MAMVFFQSVTSPLFSKAWTPADPGAYAGTCIFLIVLATVHRILIALRNIYFCSAVLSDPRRTKELSGGSGNGGADCCNSNGPDDDAVVGPGYRRHLGRREGFWAALRRARRSCPFRTSTETARAVAEVVISGVGYLLMLAVMTMNVGYFLSVLGGIFLGAFMVGRFGAEDHH
ncbi:Ctr copper transporter [Microdochium trichocladiopsis]|uniref:Copper transport protein n=1 Tax=Microdochium trichocladiopsis TaxID=1682393 RepID=A0A9P8XXG2_9PEZI|nr:Ctr copper transporter [Microdochium trichocladiopsis]KAH7024618.1 Ctr copper transporter [Microdochium trichocladiopsis]